MTAAAHAAAPRTYPLPRLRPSDDAHARAIVGRALTPAEVRILDVAWSEHCSYRSSKDLPRGLPTRAPHVVIGPGEDAGIVSLAPYHDTLCAVLAHESHNHPSQLLPVEGAATGIGGIVRDVYCMGGTVVGVMNALRFGDPAGPNAATVRSIVRGVVRGIGLYGNALGVPTLGGDVEFDASFDANCLVNVVALGTVERAHIIHSAIPAEARDEPYVLVLVGKATDDTGLGGASFASAELDGTFESAGAVQVPDPFMKRVLTEALAEACTRMRALDVAIGAKDLGAGGLATAASELAAKGGYGCDVDVDRVPAAIPGLPPDVIACAETQERYIFALPETVAAEFCAIVNDRFELGRMSAGAAASVIGRPRTDDRVVFRALGETICDIPAGALNAAPQTPHARTPRVPRHLATHAFDEIAGDLAMCLRRIIAHPAVASRASLFDRFDGDVQGRTVLRRGVADAGVVRAHPDARVGLALSVDGASRVGAVDARAGAQLAAAEAMRNVACTGAIPWALTDCLNFGSPDDPLVYDDLARSIEALAEVATTLHLYGQPGTPVPFVSGNVSLYNQSATHEAIAPSPIVACLGVVPDIAQAVGTSATHAGASLVVLGEPVVGLGASVYAEVAALSDDVPRLDLHAERALHHCIIELVQTGHVAAAHDTSAGGLLVTLAEMLMPLGWGARVDLSALASAHGRGRTFFAEAGTIVAEVRDGALARVHTIAGAHGVPCTPIGVTTGDRLVDVTAGDTHLRIGIDELHGAWRQGVLEALR